MNSLNAILDREGIAKSITDILLQFSTTDNHLSFKKGIYIYGSPGCGKTGFVVSLLRSLDYDVITYDAGDVRNKSLIETIASNNVSNRNVLDMMRGRVKKIAIVMDEIDGMNTGDKGGITALIKLIRQKKTKRQKLEHHTLNPIICIGNYYVDKKIKDLIKVCHAFELKPPTTSQMTRLLESTLSSTSSRPSEGLTSCLLEYMQGDLRKLQFIREMWQKKPHLLTEANLGNILQVKCNTEDSKQITETLFRRPVPLQQHNVIMNDNERTIVALLWHENVADVLSPKIAPEKRFPFYVRVLKNMCFADYIDRITFQNQIWLFNEMSSLIKTFYNNTLLHENFKQRAVQSPVRFTKVLTKYSTEYNNSLFIFNMCQELNVEKKDLFAMFQELRLVYGKEIGTGSGEVFQDMLLLFENTTITKLDVKRMYRYLDKNVKKDVATLLPEVEDDDDDENCGD